MIIPTTNKQIYNKFHSSTYRVDVRLIIHVPKNTHIHSMHISFYMHEFAGEIGRKYLESTFKCMQQLIIYLQKITFSLSACTVGQKKKKHHCLFHYKLSYRNETGINHQGLLSTSI